PACRDASEVVILANGASTHITTLLRKLIRMDQLIKHQRAVVNGEITPSY
ncbi:YhfZ family protein, partial [Vibrio anguillarum]